MGWKEFAASVIGDVLSWPVAFLVAVLLLLKPIKRLIGRVRSVKGGGLDVELQEELREAGVAALEASQEAQETGPENPHPDSENPAVDTAAEPEIPKKESPPEKESRPKKEPPTQKESQPEKESQPQKESPPQKKQSSDASVVSRVLDFSADGRSIPSWIGASHRESAVSSNPLIWTAPFGVFTTPEEIIDWSWGRLEMSVRSLYRAALKKEPKSGNTVLLTTLALRRQGLVSDNFVKSVEGLNTVFAELKHRDTYVTRTAANDFRETVHQLVEIANRLAEKMNPLNHEDKDQRS